jgi:hypothetical protein
MMPSAEEMRIDVEYALERHREESERRRLLAQLRQPGNLRMQAVLAWFVAMTRLW